MAETLTAGYPAVSMAGRPSIMNKKVRLPLTLDQIEYLADLLRYELADPEPRLANSLEPEQVEELQKKLRTMAIEFDHWSPQ